MKHYNEKQSLTELVGKTLECIGKSQDPKVLRLLSQALSSVQLAQHVSVHSNVDNWKLLNDE